MALKQVRRIDPAVYNTTGADLKEDFVLDELALERKVDAFDDEANDILTFTLPEETEDSTTIDADAHTVDIEVENGTSVTALTPTLTVSERATVSPASGVEQNFTGTVTYTVTSEDGTAQAWTVDVTEA